MKTVNLKNFHKLVAKAKRVWVVGTLGYAIRISARVARRHAAMVVGLNDKLPCFINEQDLFIDCKPLSADFQVSE